MTTLAELPPVERYGIMKRMNLSYLGEVIEANYPTSLGILRETSFEVIDILLKRPNVFKKLIRDNPNLLTLFADSKIDGTDMNLLTSCVLNNNREKLYSLLGNMQNIQ